MTSPTEPRPRKRARRLAPDTWVSLRPNGIGLQKPNHFGEMARTSLQEAFKQSEDPEVKRRIEGILGDLE